MTTATASGQRTSSLRFALRELRGGLRGFYVFIACIALGVDGDCRRRLVRAQPHRRARARRPRDPGRRSVVLADPPRGERTAERKFLDGTGQVSVAATMRAMARAGDGRDALVEIKAVDGAYPLYGAVALDPDGALPTRSRGATASTAPPPIQRCSRGSISSRAHASPSATPASRSRAALKSEPDKLAGGIGFGPRADRQRGGAARDRPAPARQPGALALSAAICRHDANDRAARRGDRGGQRRSFPMPAGKCARRTNASPALERNVERFTQYPHAGRPDRAAGRRRRRRQCGEEPSRPQARRHRHPEVARRHRRPRVRDLPDRR